MRNLEQRCFPADAWPLWDIIGVLTMPNIVRLKATSNDALVGFIAGEVHEDHSLSDHAVNGPIAWISTVGVLPEYRGLGIGTALMKACEGRRQHCNRAPERTPVECGCHPTVRKPGLPPGGDVDTLLPGR